MSLDYWHLSLSTVQPVFPNCFLSGSSTCWISFRLCLREDRYLSFWEAFFQYIRELDDAVESFVLACMICVGDEEHGEAERGIPYDRISDWIRKEEYRFFNKKDVQS